MSKDNKYREHCKEVIDNYGLKDFSEYKVLVGQMFRKYFKMVYTNRNDKMIKRILNCSPTYK